MALFTTVLTPNSLNWVTIVCDDSILSSLFALKKNCINHSFSNFKIIFGVSRQVHMERFFFLSHAIKKLSLKIDRPTFLRSSSTNLYFTFALFFKFLLCLSLRAYDLADIINIWVHGHINFSVFLRRSVIFWMCIVWVHSYYLRDKTISLFGILIFKPLISCICSQTTLRVILRLWWHWS